MLARQGGVDLFWAPNDEHDLAGYRVYRRKLPDGKWRQITPQLVTATAWTDTTTVPGTTYEYAVTALDVQVPTNESQRSPSRRVNVPLPTPPETEP